MSDHFGRCSTLVSCQSLPKAFKLHSGKDKILWYNTIIMRMITQWWYRRATKTQNGHQNTQSPTKRLHVAAYSGRSQWKWLFISFHQVTSLISQNNRCVHFRREDTHTHTQCRLTLCEGVLMTRVKETNRVEEDEQRVLDWAVTDREVIKQQEQI